ncbi:HK97-gp10 family putative phage morphogenesis protein [Sphingobium sp. UBA5915]|uniref:HK97-gp10 family putative phage morphogenesis protein n=1 Tax=Sphingobium sp. UBA5915 TaxID=1947530 RepID=UPI0025CDC083|nr:HK97-gp10 family putative phage morphogenesis protein [Sphingobium sp. UBA5915]
MKSHKARLRQLRSPAMKREVGKAVVAAADLIKVDAQVSISEGSVSGRNHTPSAPGSAPNYDTGHLSDNITARRTGLDTAEVSSNAQYSAPLEFGTSKMAARPFMQPAAEKNRKKATALVVEAVKRVTKG